MAPAVERRDHVKRYASDRSKSPIRDRHSPRRKSSPRRDRSPAHRRSSPKNRSPARTSSSHRMRSPVKEKSSDRARSPKHERRRSPIRTSSSHSPSPHTKRSRLDRAKREAENVMDRDHGRNASREGRDKGRHRERGDIRDVSSDRRLVREKRDVISMKSSRRERTGSPEERSHKSRQSPRSPPRVPKAGARDEASTVTAAEQSRDSDHDSVAKMKAAAEALEAQEKQKPSFELSGKLAEETNRVRGVTLLFNEPPDARKPDIRWRLYVFKAGEVLNEPLYVHRQSCYLFGRERRVADIPTDHPSCSKQHAVLQYRLVEKEQPDGLLSKQPRICSIARELNWLNYLNLGRKFMTQPICDSLSNFNTSHPRTSFMEMLLLARDYRVFTLYYINDPTAFVCIFDYPLAYGSMFCWQLEKVITCMSSLIFDELYQCFKIVCRLPKCSLEQVPEKYHHSSFCRIL